MRGPAWTEMDPSLSDRDRCPTEGHWLGGKRHGHGTHEFPSGGQFSGEFKNGMRHGQGRYIYPGGDVYTGQFVAGYREGEGEYVYAQGGSYTGEWLCDHMHGFGKAKDATGKVLSGLWIKGNAHGVCRLEDGQGLRSVCYNHGALVSTNANCQQDQQPDNSNSVTDMLSNFLGTIGCGALGCAARYNDSERTVLASADQKNSRSRESAKRDPSRGRPSGGR